MEVISFRTLLLSLEINVISRLKEPLRKKRLRAGSSKEDSLDTMTLQLWMAMGFSC